MTSIRRRLLLVILLTTSLVWLVIALTSLWATSREVDEIFDNQIRQVAATLSNLDLSQIAVAVDNPGFEHFDPDDPFAAVVWDASGKVLFQSALAPTIPFQADATGFFALRSNADDWRIYRVVDTARGWHLAVARPDNERDELIADFAVGLLAPWLLALLAMLALIWYGIGHGLMPLARLSEEIAERRMDQLSPLAEQAVPEEVRPLVNALNMLLRRVEAALQHERRFTDDAAHELRTPLAALKVHAEIAATTRDDTVRAEALTRLSEGIVQMSRLIDSMLSLARLDPLERPPDIGWHRLSELAREILAERVPMALERGIDISLEGDEEAEVLGNRMLIERMVGNLIDNAIYHAPEGGWVKVRIERNATDVQCIVHDNGPGVPDDLLDRLGERFMRTDPNKPGAGLGLSIVRRIAELHGVQLQFHNEGGLLAVLRFDARHAIPPDERFGDAKAPASRHNH